MNNKLLISTFALSLLLSACGGGGSGDGASQFKTAARIDLTSVNTDEAAAEGAGSTVSSGIAAAKGGVQKQKTNNKIASIVSDFNDLAKLKNKTVYLGVENCAISGTSEISYDDETFDIEVEYNNCSEYGELSNGSLSGTFSDSGNTFISTMEFDNFTIESTSSSDDFSMRMHGKMKVTEITYSSFDRSIIDGNSMLIEMTYSGRGLAIGNYEMTYDDYYYSYPEYDIGTFEYDMNSTELGGSLHVKSIQDIYQRYSDDNPYAGQIKLTGADNASILITIIDEDNIQVETDADGDSTYEKSEYISWSDLEDYLV